MSSFSASSDQIRDALKTCLSGTDDFVELRYHAKTSHSVTVEKGRVENFSSRQREGTGVRVLVDGGFGFAACGSYERGDVKAAIERARAAARQSAARRRERVAGLARADLARGHFEIDGIDDVVARSLEEKAALARQTEEKTRGSSAQVATAICSYTEIVEHKVVVTSDGADCSMCWVRPEFRIAAVAEADGQRQVASRSMGVTGGWECLFRADSALDLGDQAARTAVDLLEARRADGGRATVILAPSIVGLLVHEAIGHTVEADFVQAGSVAAGKIGERVGSELVTLCDSGQSEHAPGAGGTVPVDDEGVIAGRVVIIDRGVLKSYLHDRESARRFAVEPTGSARAWEYSDTPLIRMRNTYLEPGDSSLEEMIAGVRDGLLLDGPKNGQADSTGEFMFGVERAWQIRDGKLGSLVRGVTLSGVAFDVMRSVDAVSRDFRWELGSGHCGKGQPAKVDAGGPYVRCRALVGGDQ